MKDSGIEWIGYIPEHWNLSKLKHVCKIERGKFSHRPRDDPSLYGGPYPFIQTGDIERANDTITSFSQSLNEQGFAVSKMFPSNTIVMTIAATIGSTAITTFPICFPDSIVGFHTSKLDINYLYNFLKILKVHLEGIASITTQKNINYEFLKPIPVPIPTNNEQKNIVNYLNKKTKEIDHEISKNQKLIDLLKEQRQSIINHTVTRGLDDTVQMKDSGIEWIGKIPEHWNIIKLKFLTIKGDSIKPGPFGSDLKTSDFVDNGFKIYNQKDILDTSTNDELHVSKEKFQKLSSFQVKSGDLLLTSRGSIGKSIIVPKNYLPGIIHPCLIRVRINESKINKSYVNLIINESDMFKENIHVNSNGTVIEVIYAKTLKEIYMPIPGLNKQEQILKYLDEKTKKTDSLISKIESQIQKLQEFRQSLILSAVTGKICVTV